MGTVLHTVTDNGTLSPATGAVGGFGRAATTGVKGETSEHVTVWALNGLSLHCYCSGETQFRAHVCDPPINLDPCPPVAPTSYSWSWQRLFLSSSGLRLS